MHNINPDIIDQFGYDDKFAFDILTAAFSYTTDHCENNNQEIPKFTLVAITETMVMPAGTGKLSPEILRQSAAQLLNLADEYDEQDNK